MVVPGGVLLGGVEGRPDDIAVEVEFVAEAAEVCEFVGDEDQELVAGSVCAGLDRVLLAGSPGSGLLLSGRGGAFSGLGGELDEAQNIGAEVLFELLGRVGRVLQSIVQDAGDDHILRDAGLGQEDAGDVEDVDNVRRPAGLTDLAFVTLEGRHQCSLDVVHFS